MEWNLTRRYSNPRLSSTKLRGQLLDVESYRI